ncbi:hypothetical protein MKX03_035042 [Papaver bracteatum]|nr:hypothetical protein MKX03_035042 [Papaver bracteatum]
MVDFIEQDKYEAMRALYNELFDLRMQSISLIWDRNSPDRDLNLLNIDILISIVEKKLKSLQVEAVGNSDATEVEDEIVMEEVIIDSSSGSNFTQQSSNPPVPDASDEVLDSTTANLSNWSGDEE